MRSQSKHGRRRNPTLPLSDGPWGNETGHFMPKSFGQRRTGVIAGALRIISASSLTRAEGQAFGVLQGHRGATRLTSHYRDPLILPVTADRRREP